MRFLRRLAGMLRVLPTARRHRLDLVRYLARRPLHLAATGVGELAVLGHNRVEPRLRALAEMRAAAMVSCEFCLDIGAALARHHGITTDQVRQLHRFEASEAFDEEERLVLRYATQVSSTPAIVDPDLREELERRLGPAGLAELAFAVAWEHKRARLNQALGVRPAGFGDGLVCAIPEGVQPAALPSGA